MAVAIEGSAGRAGFLKGFLVTAVFVLILFCLVPVRYEENDDFAIVSNLSQRSGFSADPREPALSTSLGWILYFLYGYAPDFPWFGLSVCAAFCLGWSLMLSVLFRSTQGLSLLLSLPFLGMVFLHISSFISFTTASLILELGILLCLMECVIRDRCPARDPRVYGWALALAFLLAYLFRWRLVLSSLVFGGPLLLFVKKQQMARAMPVVMAVCLVVAGDRAIFCLTTTDQHRAFMEYNDLRARFHDTARGDYHGVLTQKALRKVGWSLEDYAFYRGWILYDNTKFNTETLGVFLRENDPKQEDSLLVLKRERLARHFKQGRHYILAVLFSILSLGFYRARGVSELPRKNRLKVVFALAYIGGGILWIVSIRSVLRVYVPLYAYFFGASFLFLHVTKGVSPQGRSRSVGRIVAVTCAVVFSILAWGQAYAQGKREFIRLRQSKTEKEYLLSRLDEVEQRRTGSDPFLILMSPTGGLGQKTIHPLKEFRDFTALRVFPAGWGVNSPRYFSVLQEMGLQDGRALLEWMIDNEDALLVLMARDEMDALRWRGLWTSYFSRQIVQDRQVRLVPVYDFRDVKGSGLVIYSVRSKR